MGESDFALEALGALLRADLLALEPMLVFVFVLLLFVGMYYLFHKTKYLYLT